MPLKYRIPDGDYFNENERAIRTGKQEMLYILAKYHEGESITLEKEREKLAGMKAHNILVLADCERQRMEMCLAAHPHDLDLQMIAPKKLTDAPTRDMTIVVATRMEVDGLLKNVREHYPSDAVKNLLRGLVPQDAKVLQQYAYWKHASVLRSACDELKEFFPDDAHLKIALGRYASHLHKLEKLYCRTMREIRRRARKQGGQDHA